MDFLISQSFFLKLKNFETFLSRVGLNKKKKTKWTTRTDIGILCKTKCTFRLVITEFLCVRRRQFTIRGSIRALLNASYQKYIART